MLILATVSISLVINNGVLDKAQHGVDKYSEEEELEQIKLAVTAAMLKGNGFLDTENLNRELHERIDENKNAEKTGNTWYYKDYVIYENGNVEKYDKLLPNEYQQVEYIESTGTQWIDTKIISNQDTKVEIKFLITMFKRGENTCLFGARNMHDNRTYTFMFGGGSNSGYNDILWSAYNNINKVENNNILSTNIEYTLVKDKNKTYLNGNLIYEVAYENFTTPYSIYLCAVNQTSRELFCAYLRIYEFKIYDNDLERNNYIPCYSTTTVTNADGKTVPANTKGLYDTVEGKFYKNQNTSEDDFIAGPNV